MPWELIFVFLIVLLGGFIQGVSGFGCGLVVMGFLPLFFSIKDSTLIVVPLLTVLSLMVVIKLYKHIEYKSLAVILLFGLAGRIAAFPFLNTYGEMEFLQLYLGIFLIGMAGYMFLDKGKKNPAKKMHPILPVVLGFIGGFVGGVFAVGGPFFVFYFLLMLTTKHTYLANLQVTFFVTNLMTVILHGLNGDIHSVIYLNFFVGLTAVLLGTMIGLRVFEKLPAAQIKKFAISLVMLAGMSLVVF